MAIAAAPALRQEHDFHPGPDTKNMIRAEGATCVINVDTPAALTLGTLRGEKGGSWFEESCPVGLELNHASTSSEMLWSCWLRSSRSLGHLKKFYHKPCEFWEKMFSICRYHLPSWN